MARLKENHRRARLVSKALGIAVVLCGLMLACGCADAASTSTSEWAMLSGQNVSLRLPSSFEGGDPADPQVLRTLREIAESRSNPEERESLLDLLDRLDAQAGTNYGSLLIAWHAPEDGGPIASVGISIDSLQNLLVLTGGDPSMKGLVEGFYGTVAPEHWELESLGPTEASVVVRYPEEGADAPATLEVIRVSGDVYYEISYSCREASWTAWYDIFKMSAESFAMVP